MARAGLMHMGSDVESYFPIVKEISDLLGEEYQVGLNPRNDYSVNIQPLEKRVMPGHTVSVKYFARYKNSLTVHVSTPAFRTSGGMNKADLESTLEYNQEVFPERLSEATDFLEESGFYLYGWQLSGTEFHVKYHKENVSREELPEALERLADAPFYMQE